MAVVIIAWTSLRTSGLTRTIGVIVNKCVRTAYYTSCNIIGSTNGRIAIQSTLTINSLQVIETFLVIDIDLVGVTCFREANLI